MQQNNVGLAYSIIKTFKNDANSMHVSMSIEITPLSFLDLL